MLEIGYECERGMELECMFMSSRIRETKDATLPMFFLAASVMYPFLEDRSVHTVRAVHGDPRGKRGLRLWSLRSGAQ